jgi:hypothetical protein
MNLREARHAVLVLRAEINRHASIQLVFCKTTKIDAHTWSHDIPLVQLHDYPFFFF